MNKRDTIRFNSKINKQGPYPEPYCIKIHPALKGTRCHIWTGYCDKEGYARFQHKGIAKLAHRVKYELCHGRTSRHVLHYCDRRSCVRDEHLWSGTNLDNILDKTIKGRGNQPKGAKHWKAKLTSKDVDTIRRKYSLGIYTQTQLADHFGVNQPHISAIVRKSKWRCVTANKS